MRRSVHPSSQSTGAKAQYAQPAGAAHQVWQVRSEQQRYLSHAVGIVVASLLLRAMAPSRSATTAAMAENWEFSAPGYYDFVADNWVPPDDGYFGE
jgi:hypothetical protein